MAHKFNTGQIVELMPKVVRAAAVGPYEIRFLVPASDTDPRDPFYRIKSVAEKHERIAPESELTLAGGVFAYPLNRLTAVDAARLSQENVSSTK